VTASFANKTVENNKTVTILGVNKSGADAANYTITQPTATASITAKALTVSGITANNKFYDGNTSATINVSSAALSGVIGSDIVSLDASSAIGAFDSKDVGNNKTVAISGLSLSGLDSINYVVTQPTTLANIVSTDATVTWTGNTSTDWNVANNWDVRLIPLSTCSVVIASAGNQPTLNTSISVNNMNINSGATFTMGGGSTLTITGNWTNNGTFVAGNGEVVLNPTTTSIITGNNTFNNLTCQAAGKTITFEAGSLQDIKGKLTLNGTSGNLLIFNSTVSGTQWKINPEGAVSASYLNGYDSNNIGTTITASNSTFVRCTGWNANIPTPGPSNNINTPQINDSLFFPNMGMPEAPIQLTLSEIAVVAGPGVMMAVPVPSVRAVPSAASFGRAANVGLIPDVVKMKEEFAQLNVTVNMTQPISVSAFEGVYGLSNIPEIETEPMLFEGVSIDSTLSQPVIQALKDVAGSVVLPSTDRVSFEGVYLTSISSSALTQEVFIGASASSVLPAEVKFENIRSFSVLEMPETKENLGGMVCTVRLPQTASFDRVHAIATVPKVASFEGSTSAAALPEIASFKGFKPAATLSSPVSFSGVQTVAVMPPAVSFKDTRAVANLMPLRFEDVTNASQIKVMFPNNMPITAVPNVGMPLGSEKPFHGPSIKNTDKEK
ncbi:MAG: YDG domain-containing protein, partial [Candidatus Omnitrophota bacterium]